MQDSFFGGAYASDSNVLLARVFQYLGDDTLLLKLKVHLRLVGLDLDQHVSRCYRVADLLLPRADVSRGHGRGQGGHADDGMRGEGCAWPVSIALLELLYALAAHISRHSILRGRRVRVCVCYSSGQQASSGRQLQTVTYAADSALLEAVKLPLSAIEPLRLNWLPARDKRVVVAGIVTGCRWAQKNYPERDRAREWCCGGEKRR
jgi:hypothetical protein